MSKVGCIILGGFLTIIIATSLGMLLDLTHISSMLKAGCLSFTGMMGYQLTQLGYIKTRKKGGNNGRAKT